MTKQKMVKKSKLIEKSTYKSLQNVMTEGKKQHGKSQKTTGAYNGYVCCGKDFLGQFADDAKNDLDVPLSGDNDDGSQALGKPKMNPKFHHAFEGQPIKCMPCAISLFMAHKCFTEGLGKTTAESIHAAFLHHYSTMYCYYILLDGAWYLPSVG